jgi:hypothetical protein
MFYNQTRKLFMRFTKFKIKPRHVIIASWGTLGFYRGVNYFGEDPYPECNNVQHLYSKALSQYSLNILYGLMGTCMYLNPFLCFIIIPREIYRLDVNIRGLEDEKKTDYYRRLLL